MEMGLNPPPFIENSITFNVLFVVETFPHFNPSYTYSSYILYFLGWYSMNLIFTGSSCMESRLDLWISVLHIEHWHFRGHVGYFMGQVGNLIDRMEMLWDIKFNIETSYNEIETS